MNRTAKRILVVDDEITFLNTVRRHLRRNGFILETAADGKRASTLIRQRAEEENPFDLVISDVVMPDMNGIELLNWVKQRFPKVSFILLTGFGESDAVSDVVRPRFDSFGAKPITPEKMLALIRKVFCYRRGSE